MSAAVGSLHFRAIITPTLKHSVQQKCSTKHRQNILCHAKSSAEAPDIGRRATLFSLAAAAVTTQLQLPAQAQGKLALFIFNSFCCFLFRNQP
jgi:hypothetical protein